MAANLTWHASTIDHKTRCVLRNQRGLTLWMTGLSASGKSTIAIALEQYLLSKGLSAYRLDGDNIRLGLNKDLGFSHKDRVENIRRISEVALLFADSCTINVTSFISPYKADRDLARKLHEAQDIPFIEIYISVSLEIAEARDPKGLYARARKGELKDFTGIDAPYEAPLSAEIVIASDKLDVPEAVSKIVEYLTSNGFLTP